MSHAEAGRLGGEAAHHKGHKSASHESSSTHSREESRNEGSALGNLWNEKKENK